MGRQLLFCRIGGDQAAGGGLPGPHRAFCHLADHIKSEIVALHAAQFGDQVAHFTCSRMRPHVHFTVQDDTAADACAQHQNQTVIHSGQRPGPRFRSRCAFAIVGDGHGNAQLLLQQSGKGLLPHEPTEYPARVGYAAFGINAARHGNGTALKLAFPWGCKALDGSQQVIHARQRSGHLTAGDFLCMGIGQAVFDKCASDVDQKVLLHLYFT